MKGSYFFQIVCVVNTVLLFWSDYPDVMYRPFDLTVLWVVTSNATLC